MGVSGGLSLLAHALVDVARQMGVRAEPFALGPVSAALGRRAVGGDVEGGAVPEGAAEGDRSGRSWRGHACLVFTMGVANRLQYAAQMIKRGHCRRLTRGPSTVRA
jgi:hypothetical protein